jgi:hypothetical protein
MQGYYLIGTKITYYTDGSKNNQIFSEIWDLYKTGIYTKGKKALAEVNAIESSFQSHETTIMEGICQLENRYQDHAYGCLIGLFVDSQHLGGLKKKGIEVVQGGFLHCNDDYYKRKNGKFSWGTIDKPKSAKLAASFFTGYYLYSINLDLKLGYSSNKPALISHLWHGEDLVFGNKENSQFTSRKTIGKEIRQSWRTYENITYTLSIS